MMAMALYAQARPISHSEAYGIASGFIAGKAHSGHRTPVLEINTKSGHRLTILCIQR